MLECRQSVPQATESPETQEGLKVLHPHGQGKCKVLVWCEEDYLVRGISDGLWIMSCATVPCPANHFAPIQSMNSQNNFLMKYHWMVPMDKALSLQMRKMGAREVSAGGHSAGQ